MPIDLFCEFPVNAPPVGRRPLYMPLAGKYEASGFNHGLNDHGRPARLPAYVRGFAHQTVSLLQQMPRGRMALNLTGHIGASGGKLVSNAGAGHHVAALRALAKAIGDAGLAKNFQRRWIVYADVEVADFTTRKRDVLRKVLWTSRWWKAGKLPDPAIVVWYCGAGPRRKSIMTPDGGMPPDMSIDQRTSFVMAYLVRSHGPVTRARYTQFSKTAMWNSAIDAINAVLDARQGGYEPVPLICGHGSDENGVPIDADEWAFRRQVFHALVAAGASRFIVFNNGFRHPSTGAVTDPLGAEQADNALGMLVRSGNKIRKAWPRPARIEMDADVIRVGQIKMTYQQWRKAIEG